MPTSTQHDRPARTHVEIRPGEGGAEAGDFADELTATVVAYLRILRATATTSKTAGRTRIIATDLPTERLSWLAGTHRVQRIPRGSAARHTSTATIAVLPVEKAPTSRSTAAELDDAFDEGQVRVDRYRGHGKGGQRRNKVSTAVRLVHEPTGIVIVRENGRSQSDNLADARRELAERLADRAAQRSRRRTDSVRGQQVVADRAAKTFTHNEQRGEVVDHDTGRRWSTKDWRRCRLD